MRLPCRDGHYVNNDPSTFELDPIRNECRSCHSVDPNKKLGDDATYEEAEVETGQEGPQQVAVRSGAPEGPKCAEKCVGPSLLSY